MLVRFGSVVDALRCATEMLAGGDERNPLGTSALDLPREPERAYRGVWVTTAIGGALAAT